jgi:hypothetical protein
MGHVGGGSGGGGEITVGTEVFDGSVALQPYTLDEPD